MKEKILIIGYGTVGKWMGKVFPNADWVDEDEIIYPVNPDKEWKKQERYDLAFVCVPTPAKENGECDTSIVEAVLERYKDTISHFCIKSTVPIGFTDKVREELSISVCMSPEYVGTNPNRFLLREPNPEGFFILGGPKKTTTPFANAIKKVTNSVAKIMKTTSKTAELVKLVENTYFALKVTYCNEIYEICEEFDIDYDEMRELWLLDPRMNRNHTYVFPNDRGYGGHCYPKDLKNLVSSSDNAHLLEFVDEYNENVMRKKNDILITD